MTGTAFIRIEDPFQRLTMKTRHVREHTVFVDDVPLSEDGSVNIDALAGEFDHLEESCTCEEWTLIAAKEASRG
ncbi:hypothetical protein [Salininema proteolyticum]|uniref:Uncharacterized protein n=1 Tax=Salininema proteolyticum TaxID=1607685 RepID=A0ABV8U5A2_9ACTN